MLNFLVFEKIFYNFAKISRNLFGISRKSKILFLQNFAKFITHFVKISCFAKFLKCCFAALSIQYMYNYIYSTVISMQFYFHFKADTVNQKEKAVFIYLIFYNFVSAKSSYVFNILRSLYLKEFINLFFPMVPMTGFYILKGQSHEISKISFAKKPKKLTN